MTQPNFTIRADGQIGVSQGVLDASMRFKTENMNTAIEITGYCSSDRRIEGSLLPQKFSFLENGEGDIFRAIEQNIEVSSGTLILCFENNDNETKSKEETKHKKKTKHKEETKLDDYKEEIKHYEYEEETKNDEHEKEAKHDDKTKYKEEKKHKKETKHKEETKPDDYEEETKHDEHEKETKHDEHKEESKHDKHEEEAKHNEHDNETKYDEETNHAINEAKKFRKPLKIVNLCGNSQKHNIKQVLNWVKVNKIRHLNIKGPRESNALGIYKKTDSFIYNLLNEMNNS
ncbi:38740_t:CDS:1 [Gigaspora margarita]|uniref:38740_t:CDS:1 n=1 Tax=Gigaspora margarita TaxID=4874 RepID=A0ABN7VZ10_GIGMA|nr:38740_t:CDS:1 [Gigaspora margarita]